MKKKLMAAALLSSIAVMSAACSNKKAVEETSAAAESTTAAETTTIAETSETPLDNENIDTEDSEYFTDKPINAYGSVASVNADEGTIMVSTIIKGNGSSESTEDVIYNTIDGVPIIDAVSGLPVELKDITEGSKVYVWSGETMTLSLPAQTNLQAMVVNLPEDAAAPQYAVVKGIEWSKDDVTLTFTDQDGNKWTADNETRVSPYRTKQIASLEDVKKGSRIFIWPSDGKDSGHTSKIVLVSE